MSTSLEPPSLLRGLPKEALPDLVAKKRREVASYWRKFPGVMRFLEDHYPHKWIEIETCRLRYQAYESTQHPGLWKLKPEVCGKTPYCIVCTKAKNNRRTMQALDRFAQVTPKEKQPRFFHIVFTAPLTEDGQGWGAKASRDIPGFAEVVRNILCDLFGEGIGGMMSYHDFGERAFAKCHPHMDLTLNGWKLKDKLPALVDRIELQGRGRARVDKITAARAAEIFGEGAKASNSDFSGPVEGRREYYKVLRYQLRELVDLRKLEYKRTEQRVGWQDYRNDRTEWMTVEDFKDGYREYLNRIRSGGTRRADLHRSFGHMAKGEFKETAPLMGGQPIQHGIDCPCVMCGDWEERELDLEDAGGPQFLTLE